MPSKRTRRDCGGSVRLAAIAAALSAALALSACSLAPHYQKPATPAVQHFVEAGDWMPAHPADAASRGIWWQTFDEPTLDDLEQRLSSSNPDLQAAVARLGQARAVLLNSRSQEFPTLDADASATRERSSANAPLASLLDHKASTYNDLVGDVSFAWEVDLFGRLRNATAAARAEAQASAADLSAVELSLHAELATDYFELRGADATTQLLEAAVRDYDRAYRVTDNRYKQGIAAATDVEQADTLRQNARAQLAAVRLQRAQFAHAIAVLVGEPPSNFSIASGPLAGAPPAFDPGVPSTLLERRPDVASAERAVAAANSEIGVARAAWFPVFSLSGAAGYESTVASTWLNAPSRFWSIGPAGSLPLLDAGARLAGDRQAWAVYDESVANYRQTTLVAYQEVEDSLVALHRDAEERAADEAAAVSAKQSAYHADRRYAAGVADYLEVSTTHTAALQAQVAALSARVAEFQATIALVRATGGGWTNDAETARQGHIPTATYASRGDSPPSTR
jgi:outer membrane protein, multidrug efflux system